MQALAELLAQRGETVAAIDLDSLRTLWPENPDVPFHARLGLTNLSAIWPHFAERGARWLLLTDAVEHPDQRSLYETAVPGAVTIIVRLNVPIDRVRERLRGRETGGSLAWHLHRSGELLQMMTERGVGDIIVTIDDHDPHKSPASCSTTSSSIGRPQRSDESHRKPIGCSVSGSGSRAEGAAAR